VYVSPIATVDRKNAANRFNAIDLLIQWRCRKACI
jgi:hypothetical protein